MLIEAITVAAINIFVAIFYKLLDRKLDQIEENTQRLNHMSDDIAEIKETLEEIKDDYSSRRSKDYN